MTSPIDGYMKIAIREAHESLREGNHGFGAVIVMEDRVLARAHDTEETEADPTAHAEISAIRKACAQAGKNLSACVLLSTHEPCPMCAAAIVWAGIKRVVFGYGISDALSQGRRRIGIPCEEMFQRAGAEIVVQEGILNKECSLLYDREVRAEIWKLRGASDDRLLDLDKDRRAKRIEWYRAESEKIPTSDDPLEKAYGVLLRKFGIEKDRAPVAGKTEREIVFHSKNFCPTLEACKILGLDTRRVCRLYNEGSTDALVKQVDPALKFSRNYEKIRPYSDYCEERIGY